MSRWSAGGSCAARLVCRTLSTAGARPRLPPAHPLSVSCCAAGPSALPPVTLCPDGPVLGPGAHLL